MKRVLLSRRLELVPINFIDADKLLSLLRNDKVKQYLCDNKEIEKDEVIRIVSGSESLFDAMDIGLWWIRILESFEIIGFCGFFRGEIIEIIYVIHPDHQRKGFATEATKRLVEYYQLLNLKEDIYAKIDEPNVESIIIAEKIGMAETGKETNPFTNGPMKVFTLKI